MPKPQGTPRRALLAAGLGLLAARPAAAAGARGSAALLVGAPAAAAADIWARAFAPFLERHLGGIAIGVQNRPGQGGLAAARALAAAPPDGRLIGSVTTPLLVARAIEAGASEVLDLLDFVAVVAEEPFVLVVQAGAPANTLAMLRSSSERGVLATPPPGSPGQIAAATLEASLRLEPLPFPSGVAARQAALAGNVTAALLALPDAIGALREGKLTGIGVAARQRCSLLPDLPTLAEQGLALSVAVYRGFALPRGTPAAARERLSHALRAAVHDPEFTEQAQAIGTMPRFLDSAGWGTALTRVRGELQRRWADEPWIARRE